jgi:hypothetical protein
VQLLSTQKAQTMPPKFYWTVVHHDAASAFGVTFPDVSDCFAASDRRVDLMLAAQAALKDYAQAHPLPQKPLSEQQVRKRFAQDIADGAELMRVPHPFG